MTSRLAIVLFIFTSASCVAQSGSITKDEHDKQIKADSDRNTKYHNNADDYPMNNAPAPAPIRPRNTRPQESEADRKADAEYLASLREDVETYTEMLAKARQGDMKALTFVAGDLRFGTGTEKNVPLALEYYIKASDTDPSAAYEAAYMLLKGIEVDADATRGRELMQSAADRGVGMATKWLDEHPYTRPMAAGTFPPMLAFADDAFEEFGKDVPPLSSFNAKMVKKVLDPSNKKPDGADSADIGLTYLYGRGVPRDPKLARTLIGRHHDLGNGIWATQMAWANYACRAEDPQAFDEMEKVLQDADSSNGIVLYLQALVASVKHNSAAQRRYLELAQNGHDANEPQQAKVDRAVMELTGEGGEVRQLAAMNDLTFVAKSNRNAAYILSRIYAQGSNGAPKDPEKARAFLESAAKAGQPDALRELGGASSSAVTVQAAKP